MILSINVSQNWDTASTILSISIEHNNAKCYGTTQLNGPNCNPQNNDTQYKHWVSLCWAFLWSWVSLYWVSHVLNYAECRLILYYAEGRYAESRMSVVVSSVVIPIVVMLSVMALLLKKFVDLMSPNSRLSHWLWLFSHQYLLLLLLSKDKRQSYKTFLGLRLFIGTIS
jgi:hypothetical protein